MAKVTQEIGELDNDASDYPEILGDESVPAPSPVLDAATKNGGAFRALRHRNFRYFWFGQLISLIGTWMQNLAQGWLIVLLVDPVAHALLRHGGAAVGGPNAAAPTPQAEAAANLYSGWVNFAGGIPILVFTLFAGVVADRVDKRRMLLATQTVLIFTALALGVLCLRGTVEIWHVLFFAALSGIAAAFDMPTRQSFIVEMVGKEDLPSAVALNSSVFNGARAVGPAVAGLLLAAHVSIGAAFVGNAILTLAAIVALLLMRLPPQAKKAGAVSVGQILSNMREGFGYVRSNHTIRNLMLLVGSLATFALSFNILIPVFVRYTLLPHAGAAEQVKAFGYMETIRGVGALLGAITVAFLGGPARQKNMLIWGALASTGLLVVFGLTRSMWVAYATMALVSYGFVVCFATSNTLVQLTLPDHLRGRVMSIYTLVFIGSMPIGSFFAGWVANKIGAPPAILVCAVLSLLTTIWVAFRPGGLRDIGVAKG
ncbi:MFS transporter [Capsulimonas corticalis]|uniref:MFS transporter n=1 Tax=Capsulimonas corticalis TaxID=2219043 RepID=A0A402CPS7_9BACT|nr:MFS transporter [Capsulimonas corticalis]BDI32853.1 MFS transporter [Capsulimonas corticalis]